MADANIFVAIMPICSILISVLLIFKHIEEKKDKKKLKDIKYLIKIYFDENNVDYSKFLLSDIKLEEKDSESNVKLFVGAPELINSNQHHQHFLCGCYKYLHNLKNF